MSISLPRLIALSIVAVSTASAQAPRVNKYGDPEKRAPRPTTAAITEADLMTRLYIFADDSMQGREYGRVGNMRGTNYIANEVRKLGLQPAGDNGTYFQRLPMVQRHFTDRSTMTVDGQTLRFNTDFVPIPTGLVQAPRPIQNAQVIYAGSVAEAQAMSAEQRQGKFLLVTQNPTAGGGRGNNHASLLGKNFYRRVLGNPSQIDMVRRKLVYLFRRKQLQGKVSVQHHAAGTGEIIEACAQVQ